MAGTIDDLRQHELVILRRLRESPLTEFELIREVADHSGYDYEGAASRIEDWLDDLQVEGYIWLGRLQNNTGQSILAAALTRAGRELVR